MDTTRFELPPEGITLLGYIARRMCKTRLLEEAASMLAAGDAARALVKVGIYAAAASTSYGRAYYQPRFNKVGEFIRETDSATGAVITAKLERVAPYFITYTVEMPNGHAFIGSEQINGTTVGLRGLGMPAPSKFTFRAGGYTAELTGTLTSELALSLFGANTRIRAYGFLVIKDNVGNQGKLKLDRGGEIELSTNQQPPEKFSLLKIDWHLNETR